jgi:transcription initiation factor IIE alpha subunit
MRCSICGMEIDSMEKAIKEGWTPYFYDGETEHEFVCPGCSEVFLESGKDGEMEVRAEYRGKIKYCDEKVKENWAIGIALN